MALRLTKQPVIGTIKAESDERGLFLYGPETGKTGNRKREIQKTSQATVR